MAISQYLLSIKAIMGINCVMKWGKLRSYYIVGSFCVQRTDKKNVHYKHYVGQSIMVNKLFSSLLLDHCFWLTFLWSVLLDSFHNKGTKGTIKWDVLCWEVTTVGTFGVQNADKKGYSFRHWCRFESS